MTYPPNNDPYGNQQPPQYGQQPPQYGQPQPAQYGQQPPQYAQPQQQYGQPQPQQYGAPTGYGAPAANYAAWPLRVGAYLIDSLIFVPFYIVIIIVSQIGKVGGILAVVFYLAFLATTIYNRWIMAGKTGQSWGKKALGLRLVSEETGQPLGIGLTIGRDFAHVLDALSCYVGFLWPLWDEKRQTFADKVIKSLVVK
jgi:uncharacterized RDD family membrane protein YckC